MPQITWPWGYGVLEDPSKTAQPLIQEQEMYGPLALPNLPSPEFGPVEFIKTSVSKLSANLDRVMSANKTVLVQGEPAPAWYDISGRISQAASSVNQAFQSTLLKIIVLVVLVGALAMFGLSYVQAKGASLGK